MTQDRHLPHQFGPTHEDRRGFDFDPTKPTSVDELRYRANKLASGILDGLEPAPYPDSNDTRPQAESKAHPDREKPWDVLAVDEARDKSSRMYAIRNEYCSNQVNPPYRSR